MNDHDRHAIAAIRQHGPAISAVELDYQLTRHRRPGAGHAGQTLARLEAAGIVQRHAGLTGDVYSVRDRARTPEDIAR